MVTDDPGLPLRHLIDEKRRRRWLNGLTDIIDTFQTENFPGFGSIGSEFQRGKQVDYFGRMERRRAKDPNERIDQAVFDDKSFIGIGIDRTMSDFNNK